MPLSLEEWNARIDAFLKEENQKTGMQMPVHRIYCQDNSDRSGGGLYNETVTVDTIGRYARALGDSNPLYSDPVYAQQSIREGIVAPPLLECCICSTFIAGRMPRLRGLQVYDAGTKWERFALIRPGDSFSAVTTWKGVEECTRPGKEAQARLLLRSHEIDLYDQRGDHISRLTARSIIRCQAPGGGRGTDGLSDLNKGSQKTAGLPDLKKGNKGTAGLADSNKRSQKTADLPDRKAEKREVSVLPGPEAENVPKEDVLKKEKAGARPHYSEAQLEQVYENLEVQMRGGFRRGGIVRFWEDVEAEEELPDQIVGPYDESDGQSLMAAIGAANAFATKWGTIRGRRGTGGVIDPETGARRLPIDRHISDVAARAQGLPRAIVSGIHSQALLAKSVGDWMGDAGSLRSLDCRCKKPLYYGDLSIQRGRVVRKYEEAGKFYAVLHMEAVNQDGIVHTEAEALVQLPAAQSGPDQRV